VLTNGKPNGQFVKPNWAKMGLITHLSHFHIVDTYSSSIFRASLNYTHIGNLVVQPSSIPTMSVVKEFK